MEDRLGDRNDSISELGHDDGREGAAGDDGLACRELRAVGSDESGAVRGNWPNANPRLDDRPSRNRLVEQGPHDTSALGPTAFAVEVAVGVCAFPPSRESLVDASSIEALERVISCEL